MKATIHTMPLPGEAKVMMFVEANVSSAHERDGGTTGEAHSAWRAG